jgi:hypothetical protein
MQTEAEQNIRFVIRILRYIGWPFAILFVAMATLGIALAPFVAFSKEGTIGMGIAIAAINIPFAVFFVWLLSVAKRMAQRDPSAKSPAINLSALMLLGFPLFTIVGILCLYKIRTFYDAYCTESHAIR